MVILILEKVPVGLRGEITRWMIEPKTGVFLGRIPALVRDKLWDKVCESTKGGAGMLIHSTDTEQGFAVRLWGTTARTVVDMEGLLLAQIPES